MFPPVAMSSTLATFGFLFLLVSSAAAQATMLPQCALGCARAAATKAKCDLSDTACLCKTSSFASSVIQCAATTSCSAAEKATVSAILGGLCGAVSSSSASGFGLSSGSSTKSVSASASTPAETSSTLTTITSNPSSSPTPPPFSFPSSDIPSSSAPSGSSASTTTIPSAPSTSPSTAAARGNGDGNGAHVAGVAGAVIGLAMWVL
ncbi:hypothetical protein C8R44DRAFT_984427 [Mycena epipterygia]|nr:hypothetical protein C8R44DRAFT_984427 [Mycena epipterygia]